MMAWGGEGVSVMAWGGECEVGGHGEAELVTHHQRQTELHGSLVHFIIGLAGV